MELPDFSVGQVPNKYGVSPLAVSAYQHPKKNVGLIVMIERRDDLVGSLTFKHSMTPDQARDLSDMLKTAADLLEAEAVPYPEAVGA